MKVIIEVDIEEVVRSGCSFSDFNIFIREEIALNPEKYIEEAEVRLSE